MADNNNKVEVCFGSKQGSLYLDLPPSELPRIGETVYFGGETVKGSAWEGQDFIVQNVVRSYSKDSGELTFVNVQLDRGGL